MCAVCGNMADEMSRLLDAASEEKDALTAACSPPPRGADGGEAVSSEQPGGCCRRWPGWGVEPAIVLFFFHMLGASLTVQQMTYSIVAEEYNYSGPIPGQYEANVTCADDPTQEVVLQNVQAEVGLIMILSCIAYIFPAGVATAFMGGFSDAWGRKPAMYITVCSCVAKLAVWLSVPLFQLNVYFVILGSMCEGCGGGMMAFMLSSLAYISDSSTTERRSFRMMVGSVCVMCGAVASAVSCGFVIRYLGFVLTYVIYIGVLGVTLVYLLLLVPESLVSRKPYTRCSPQIVRDTLRVVSQDDGNNRRLLLLLLIPIAVLPQLVDFGLFGAQTLYLLNAPRCWNSIQLGLFVAVGIICMALGTLVVTSQLQRRLGDVGLMILGCIGPLVKFTMMAFAVNDLMMFSALVFGALDVTPMIAKSFSSKLVKPDEVGSLFSVFAWLELSVALADLTFTAIYRVTLVWFPGFVFLVMAGIYVITLVLTIILKLVVKRRKATDTRIN